MNKFKVGDKVKIIKDENGNMDMVGKITTIKRIRDSMSYPYVLDIDYPTVEINCWSDKELALVSPKRGFRVGDKCRQIHHVIHHVNGENPICTITKIEGDNIYHIHDEDETKFEYNCSMSSDGKPNFELVEEAPIVPAKFKQEYKQEYGATFIGADFSKTKQEVKSMEFEVGDRVRIVGASPDTHNGEEATFIRASNREYVVNLDNGGEWWCFKIELVGKQSKVKPEVVDMKIEEMKKANVKEARKQCVEEAKNQEIENAKLQYNSAVDERDRLDREIKSREELRAKQQEILDKFKGD